MDGCWTSAAVARSRSWQDPRLSGCVETREIVGRGSTRVRTCYRELSPRQRMPGSLPVEQRVRSAEEDAGEAPSQRLTPSRSTGRERPLVRIYQSPLPNVPSSEFCSTGSLRAASPVGSRRVNDLEVGGDQWVTLRLSVLGREQLHLVGAGVDADLGQGQVGLDRTARGRGRTRARSGPFVLRDAAGRGHRPTRGGVGGPSGRRPRGVQLALSRHQALSNVRVCRSLSRIHTSRWTSSSNQPGSTAPGTSSATSR